MRIELLDKGFVELVDKLGSDLTVVNSARVSFGKRKDTFDEDDKKLVNYLAKNKHYSPFRHAMVQFHIKAPEFVMRQLYKHVVGIETTSSYPTKDHAWNEISQRYTEVTDYYFPDEWRKQSESNKQASNGIVENQDEIKGLFDKSMLVIFGMYEEMIKSGVAKEMARMVLPLNTYTEVYWTGSLQAIANFVILRDHEHAQKEIRDYAIVIGDMMESLFPNSWVPLLKYMKGV